MTQNTIPRTVAKEILAIIFVSSFAITLLVFIAVLCEAVNEGLSLESTLRLLPYEPASNTPRDQPADLSFSDAERSISESVAGSTISCVN